MENEKMDFKLTPEYIRKQTKRQADHREAQKVKTQAYALGYTHAISFYGIISYKYKPNHEFRRIEVLSSMAITPNILQQLYDFFTAVKPLRTYSIWLYNPHDDDLKNVGEWD